MSNEQCKTCQHFLQHYTFDTQRLFRVYCGHCTLDRPRRKRPDAKICENFTPGTSQEEAFASREYLSKELLEYMLKLELLPPIENSEDKISHP